MPSPFNISRRLRPPLLQTPFSSPPGPSNYANPNHTNHNIEPLALPSLKLIAPHPILLIIPKRPRRRMHPPPANHVLRPCLPRFMLAIHRMYSRRCCVLDDGARDGEFVGGGALGGGGLGDEGLEDGVLEGLLDGTEVEEWVGAGRRALTEMRMLE